MKSMKKVLGAAAVGTLVVSGLGLTAQSSSAVVTPVGSCVDLLAIGKAKSTTLLPVPLGISDQDNADVSIGAKGVDPNLKGGTNLGSCNFAAGLSTPDGAKPPVKGYNGNKPVTKWGTKLFSPEADCDQTDTGDTTEWPLNGALSMAFADGFKLSAAIVVTGFTDPDNDPNTPSDVVSFAGLVTKGVAAGADVAGESEFDPIVKDTTQLTYTPYTGYQFDIAAAVGCTTATQGDGNILNFMNGSVGGVSQLLGLPVAGIAFTIGSV